MNQTGLWFAIVIAIFILGQFLMLRPSRTDEALSKLRDAGRKLGLNPKLVKLPDWAMSNEAIASGRSSGMMAYYGLIIPEATFALCQAKIVEGKCFVVAGDRHIQGEIFDVKGAVALELQSNHVGVYWDENIDSTEIDLIHLKHVLETYAKHALSRPKHE